MDDNTLLTEDENIFTAVKQFADKWGIIMIRDQGPLYRHEIDKYYMSHEWTDGDELTFFVYRKVLVPKEENGEITYHRKTEEICQASVDDWELDRSKKICDRLYKKCVENGVIQKNDV
jgi:hypothetical protein